MVAETMDDTGSKSDTGDSMLTGVVGTALYVAPELLAAGKRCYILFNESFVAVLLLKRTYR